MVKSSNLSFAFFGALGAFGFATEAPTLPVAASVYRLGILILGGLGALTGAGTTTDGCSFR